MRYNSNRLVGKLSKHFFTWHYTTRTTTKVLLDILNYTLISMSLPLNC